MDIDKKSSQNTPINCPSALETLNVGIICCLLDAPLTLLWGNSSFFRMTECAGEAFCRRYSNLKQFYSLFPDEFARIRQAVAKAAGQDRGGLSLTVRLPRQTGGFSWAQLLGTVAEDPTTGNRVLQAEFAGVDELAAAKEEQAQLYREQRHCFRSVLDTYEGNAYISDMETYELLYLNQTSARCWANRPVSLWGASAMK